MTQACSETICFVEDSDTDFEMATLAIARMDPQLSVVQTDSYDGIRQALELPSLRLIVIDINLPNDNGIELLRRLRCTGVRCGVGVVVFSTSTSPNDRRDALAIGADAYHEKPTDAADFLDCVTRLVSPWVDAGGVPPV